MHHRPADGSFVAMTFNETVLMSNGYYFLKFVNNPVPFKATGRWKSACCLSKTIACCGRHQRSDRWL